MKRLLVPAALAAYLGQAGCAPAPPSPTLLSTPVQDSVLEELAASVTRPDRTAELFAAPCRGDDPVEVAQLIYEKMQSAGLYVAADEAAFLRPLEHLASSEGLLNGHGANELSLALFFARCARSCVDLPVGLAVRKSPFLTVDVLVPSNYTVNQYDDVDVQGRKWAAVSFSGFNRNTFERAAADGRQRFGRQKIMHGARIPDDYPIVRVFEPKAYAKEK